MEEHNKVATDPTASADCLKQGLVRETTSAESPVQRDSTSLTAHVICSEHSGKEVEFYCKTCEILMCLKCTQKSGKHHGHDYEERDKAFLSYRKEIAGSLEPMEKQLAATKRALTQLDTCCGEISDQQAGVEADIQTTFRHLQEILDVRKTKLIHQLHQITQGKLKRLAVQRDLIETKQAQFNSCLAFMKNSLKTDSQEDSALEALKAKGNVVKQVKELTTFPPDILKPITEADMALSVLAGVATTCQNYGQILATGLLDPSNCSVDIDEGVVGEMSTAVLHTVDYWDQPCQEPIQSYECELVSELTGARTSGYIERRHDQYEISYRPTIKGKHQLHVKVEDQHIKGSPFKIAAKSSVERLGTPIKSLDGLGEPLGVVVRQNDEVVVTDLLAHCVSVFSPNGEKLRSFGVHGSGQGQFDRPYGIAEDGEGNILVVDWGNHRIQKFTAAGRFLTAVGKEGTGRLEFGHPCGIVFNPKNKKVYVSDNNQRIQVLNSNLTFSSTFGEYLKHIGMGRFDLPRGIACDSAGNVYVADRDHHRIQVFTAEGQFLRMFGKHGNGKGQLNGPTGISIDSNDMVYITELRNHRISLFTSGGKFVTSFGSCGTQSGQFQNPHGICVDSSGVVYVCDRNNMRVQLF